MAVGGFQIGGPDTAAIITALGGIIVGIWSVRRSSTTERNRLESEERSEILRSYADIVKNLQNEVMRLRTQSRQDDEENEREKLQLLDRLEDAEYRLTIMLHPHADVDHNLPAAQTIILEAHATPIILPDAIL